MKFIYSMVLIASVGVAVQAMPSAVQSQMQSSLEKFMAQASLDSTNPGLSAQCFALYLPMLNEIATGFSSEYQACITIANNKTSNLTEQAAKSQVLYQQEVSQICSAFATCDNENDTVAFFNCYSAASQDDVSVVYDLSTNAANSASVLLDGIKEIQQGQYQCTNATESTYVRDTAATYDLLDNCLKNGVPTSTTTVAPSQSTTSPAPSSTSASSSAAPSTAASSTSTSSSAAPSTAASSTPSSTVTSSSAAPTSSSTTAAP